MYFVKAPQLESAAVFDEVGFGGVRFVVDEGDDDDGREVAEFGWNVERFGGEDELALDSMGRRCEDEEGLCEDPQEFVSVEHR